MLLSLSRNKRRKRKGKKRGAGEEIERGWTDGWKRSRSLAKIEERGEREREREIVCVRMFISI